MAQPSPAFFLNPRGMKGPHIESAVSCGCFDPNCLWSGGMVGNHSLAPHSRKVFPDSKPYRSGFLCAWVARGLVGHELRVDQIGLDWSCGWLLSCLSCLGHWVAIRCSKTLFLVDDGLCRDPSLEWI